MNTVFCAINAKYIHTNIAVRYLNAVSSSVCNTRFVEFTINQSPEIILDELLTLNPDTLLFSCYIWNISYVEKLCHNIKKILPNITIILGGPEVSHPPFPEFPYDFIVCGEGETEIPALLKSLSEGVFPTEKIIIGKPVEDLDSLPFPYDFQKEDLAHRIVYYEASRGCPFNCSYCLSSATKGVRIKSVKRVKEELKIFMDIKVMQVKFVDRTFNADNDFFIEILKFLKESDNGITNFHFEVAASLISDEALTIIPTLRSGLIQLEIGVQSTNENTLKAINRNPDTEKLFAVVDKLQSFENTHLHLDLIAGLPHEDLSSFKKSFDDVYAHHPNQLQLGFLKLLKGTSLIDRALEFGINIRNYPPYEVLSTNSLSYDDISNLKKAETMIDHYYNSGRYHKMLGAILPYFSSPFDFYLQLGIKFFSEGHHLSPLSQIGWYDFLYHFACDLHPKLKNTLPQLCRFDMLCHTKPKKFPEWAANSNPMSREEFLSLIKSDSIIKKHLPHFELLSQNEIIKNISLETFDLNIISDCKSIKKQLVLFDYSSRNIDNHAKIIFIND